MSTVDAMSRMTGINFFTHVDSNEVLSAVENLPMSDMADVQYDISAAPVLKES